ncbi:MULTISPECIES: hypothetical protein [unclassified Microcoleus]|uniref:hypothetical protein n=1 Tax=unclassified Microcoleus TaxID=2642155 RepID=UPI002FCE8032
MTLPCLMAMGFSIRRFDLNCARLLTKSKTQICLRTYHENVTLRHSSGIFHQGYKFRRDRRHSKEAFPNMPLSWFGNKFYLKSGLSGHLLAEQFYQT